MIETELKTKLDKLQNDTVFIQRLFAQDSCEKIQTVFAEKGIWLSLDEVESLVVNTVNSIEKNTDSDELKEDALENVAGGFAITISLIGWACAAALTGTGIIVGWKLAKGKCQK